MNNEDKAKELLVHYFSVVGDDDIDGYTTPEIESIVDLIIAATLDAIKEQS